MRVGTYKIEITPKEPCYLCGHAIRCELSQGVMDPLYVTAVTITDSKGASVLLSYDLILMDQALTEQIKNEISREYNIKKEQIIVSFIHTHAGPETGEVSVFNDPQKGAPKGYRERLVKEGVRVVKSSLQHLVEVQAEYATTQIQGYYSNRNSKEKPCDKSANMIRFVDQSNQIQAMMVNLSCHPTVLGPQNYLISADLFGALRTALSDIYHCDVLMMQGASGDMGNRQYRQGNDQNELFRMRDGILAQLISTLSWKKLKETNLQWYPTTFVRNYLLDLTEMKDRLAKNKAQLKAEQDANQIKLLSSGIKGLENVIAEGENVTLCLKGNIIRMDRIIMICVPCELFNQFGVQLKQAFPNYDVILWGYCDYSVGYMVEECEYGKSYESIATNIKKGIPEQYIEYLKKCVIDIL